MNPTNTEFAAFVDAMRHRLAIGQVEYQTTPADRRPLAELLAEVREELEDVAGWAVLMHARLGRLATIVHQLDHGDPHGNERAPA